MERPLDLLKKSQLPLPLAQGETNYAAPERFFGKLSSPLPAQMDKENCIFQTRRQVWTRPLPAI
jgi:hypothetical protein